MRGRGWDRYWDQVAERRSEMADRGRKVQRRCRVEGCAGMVFHKGAGRFCPYHWQSTPKSIKAMLRKNRTGSSEWVKALRLAQAVHQRRLRKQSPSGP